MTNIITNINNEPCVLVQIPFSGFYETGFSDYDQYLYMDLEYFEENSSDYLETQNQIDNINHEKTRINIASEYVNQFNHYYDLDLEFESLKSPKFYNYTTDRIFAKISYYTLEKIYQNCDKNILAQVIKNDFTSYDGFSSFYDNDVKNWDFSKLPELDHNQAMTILKAYLYTEFFTLSENESIENLLENALLDACLIHEKIA